MRNFRLYTEINGLDILLSKYDVEQPEKYLHYCVYNEKLQQAENDQYTLTFSVVGNDMQQYYLQLLHIGSLLKLWVNKDELLINLYISAIKPVISKQGVVYECTALDEASYKWSKINTGYSYDNSTTGVESVTLIAAKILKQNGILGWNVVTTRSDSQFNAHFITFQVSNSNPYNALIELCNVSNSNMRINYKNKTIMFYDKSRAVFSGYRYCLDTNLSKFDVSYDGANLTTILHVTGSTDEYGNIVTLVPPLPAAMVKCLSDYSDSDWELTGSGKVEVKVEAWYDQLKTYTLGTDANGEYKYLNWTANKVGAKRISLQTEVDNYTTTEWYRYATTHGIIKYDEDMRIFFYYPENLDADDTAHTQEIEENYPKLIKAQYSLNELKRYDELTIQQKQNEEIEEIETFIKIAKRVPHLGQFYSDFSFFEKLNYDLTLLKDLLYNNMRIYNLKLQLYEPKYHELVWRQRQLETSFEGMVGQYITEKTPIATTLFQEYATILMQLYGSTGTIYNYDWFVQHSPALQEVSYYQSFLADMYVEGATDGQGDRYQAAAEQIQGYNVFNSTFSKWCKNSGNITSPVTYIGETVNNLKYHLQNLWNRLYTNFSTVIYENIYDNSTETNSVALFNQAIKQMETLNRPTSSYSLSVVDVNALEQITMPRLGIGNKIRVYNKALNYKDGEENNISFSDNELIISGLTYNLRNPGDLSITVEQIVPHARIVEKLLKSIQSQ